MNESRREKRRGLRERERERQINPWNIPPVRSFKDKSEIIRE